MKITHIRHSSHLIEIAGLKFLVDPVFGEKGSTFSLPKGRTKEKNPLVDLPFDIKKIKDLDGLIISHMHFDHFDKEAINTIDKSTPIYCSINDVKKIKKIGFKNINSIDNEIIVNKSLKITIVGGKHGSGLAGKLMGKTSGYILKDISNKEGKSLYIIGDSIWCEEVKNSIKKHKPNFIVAFAGEARLPFGKAITMSTSDIDSLYKFTKEYKIIVIHLDSWNYFFLTREKLKSFLNDKAFKNNIIIPDDGQVIKLIK